MTKNPVNAILENLRLNETKSINLGNGSTAYQYNGSYFIKKGDEKREISADQYNKLMNKDAESRSSDNRDSKFNNLINKLDNDDHTEEVNGNNYKISKKLIKSGPVYTITNTNNINDQVTFSNEDDFKKGYFNLLDGSSPLDILRGKTKSSNKSNNSYNSELNKLASDMYNKGEVTKDINGKKWNFSMDKKSGDYKVVSPDGKSYNFEAGNGFDKFYSKLLNNKN